MFALEVLQSCPLQRKALLFALGVNDDNSSSMIKFETVGLQPLLVLLCVSFDSRRMS